MEPFIFAVTFNMFKGSTTEFFYTSSGFVFAACNITDI